jgi:hypothetical protein
MPSSLFELEGRRKRAVIESSGGLEGKSDRKSTGKGEKRGKKGFVGSTHQRILISMQHL